MPQTLRDAAYGAVNSAKALESQSSPGPPGAGSALHLCTRGSLTASSWPVYGMWMARQGAQGEKKKKKKGSGWRSEQQEQLQMLRFTFIFTFGRTKRRRLPTTLRNSAFALLTRSANLWLEQTGHQLSQTQSISVLMKARPAACASKLEEEGRQTLYLSLFPQTPLGTSAESSALAQPGRTQTRQT